MRITDAKLVYNWTVQQTYCKECRKKLIRNKGDTMRVTVAEKETDLIMHVDCYTKFRQINPPDGFARLFGA
jgi:RNase P subunit RPR2